MKNNEYEEENGKNMIARFLKKAFLKSMETIMSWKVLFLLLVVMFLFLVVKNMPRSGEGLEEPFVNEGIFGTEIQFLSTCQSSKWYINGCTGPIPEEIREQAKIILNITDDEDIRRECLCVT